MRKILLVILFLIVLQLPSVSANKKMIPAPAEKGDLPNIFIYSIPEDEIEPEQVMPEKKSDKKKKQPMSEEEILLNMEREDEIVLGATTLKGYAEYIEDAHAIHLKDDNDDFVLNIKVPQKISATKGLNLLDPEKRKPHLRYTDAEYVIQPNSIKSSSKTGDFTFGALYNNEVDNIAMLETETGLFTKYEKRQFAVSSSVKKSLNTTFAQDYNTITVSPELKLNNYLSLKNNLTADVTRNRRSAELVFSLNPFGKKDKDRMLFEAGAKQTYFVDTGANRTQMNFSAKFKL